jgi:hypothetical protein
VIQDVASDRLTCLVLVVRAIRATCGIVTRLRMFQARDQLCNARQLCASLRFGTLAALTIGVCHQLFVFLRTNTQRKPETGESPPASRNTHSATRRLLRIGLLP